MRNDSGSATTGIRVSLRAAEENEDDHDDEDERDEERRLHVGDEFTMLASDRKSGSG